MPIGNPLARLAGSSKFWLAALGMVAVVALMLVSQRPWLELAIPVGAITGLLATLINAIAKEDAASKGAPTTVNAGGDATVTTNAAPATDRQTPTITEVTKP